MNTHTPGPWILDTPELIHASAPGNGRPYYHHSILSTSGQARIAEVFGNEDNAGLIAAAPELLEALRLLASAVEQFAPNGTEWPELTTARAAIAKAEGRNL